MHRTRGNGVEYLHNLYISGITELTARVKKAKWLYSNLSVHCTDLLVLTSSTGFTTSARCPTFAGALCNHSAPPKLPNCLLLAVFGQSSHVSKERGEVVKPFSVHSPFVHESRGNVVTEDSLQVVFWQTLDDRFKREKLLERLGHRPHKDLSCT
jgi:hypothetical protein